MISAAARRVDLGDFGDIARGADKAPPSKKPGK